jgi:hypothetical protein
MQMKNTLNITRHKANNMEVILRFNSAWQNSFISGSNNEPIPKGGRVYEASCKKLGEGKQFYRKQPISHNTVMGVLNRLIGDQRKLFTSRESEDYVFKNIEEKTSFSLENTVKSQEVVFLRNFGGSGDPSGTSGLLLDDHLMFSEYMTPLWSVLTWPIEKVIAFITSGKEFDSPPTQAVTLSAFGIVSMFTGTKAQTLSKDTDLSQVASVLVEREYLKKEQSEKISVETLYCSALYLKLESMDLDPKAILGGNGLLPGISKRGFTLKGLMAATTTGGVKKVYGNPYQKKILKKGEPAVDVILDKMDGILRIKIDVTHEEAVKLKQLIDDAAVSAFTLGKKGLAYVDRIHIN